jgi:hypothetical protein
MRRALLVALFSLGFGAALYAVESGELTMTIVRAEQKTRDRVVAWVVNTPIYRQDVYFEVAVRASGNILEAEYEPGSPGETLPAFWKPGAEVQGRVRGHSLFLKRPNGAEIRFVILKRTAVSAAKKTVTAQRYFYGPLRSRQSGRFHQPRGIVAEIQRARAGRGSGHAQPAPGTGEVPGDLGQQPRRIL